MSQQLAQDDDGFEIRSIADSLSDDEEQGRKDEPRAIPPSGGASTSLSDAVNIAPPRKTSPSPAIQNNSKAPPPRPRESLDGETIFAVGDDGIEWSEGEEEDDTDDETRKLNRKDTKNFT